MKILTYEYMLYSTILFASLALCRSDLKLIKGRCFIAQPLRATQRRSDGGENS
jgi:hypothetical protein